MIPTATATAEMASWPAHHRAALTLRAALAALATAPGPAGWDEGGGPPVGQAGG
jgi:hypothetical protein